MRGGRVALLVACLAALVGAGCSRAPRGHGGGWAAAAAEKNREADRRLDDGDAPGARAALLALVAAEAPRAAGSDERRLVVQDAYFRLARLALAERDARQAAGYADAGLALGTAPHVFVANLYVVRGAAHEALADARSAAEDYHRALIMNEQLLGQVLEQE